MSDQVNDLNIDLGDPKGIRKKLPQIEEIVDAKRTIASDAARDFETWGALLGRLRTLAGVAIRVDQSDSSRRPSPVQDAVVRVVEREARAMRPIGVTRALKAEGHEVASNNAVNAALYAAAEAGRLLRTGDRQYAPIPSEVS